MRRAVVGAVPVVLALGMGAVAVSVDLRNDEVQAAVLVVGVSGFILGAAWPAGAWHLAVIVGAMVPIGDYLFPRVGLAAVAPGPFNAGAFLALIPALIGAGAGVLTRRLVAAGSS